ncbi:pantothenate synthetase [Orenia metallireducens]|uniref:Pantothenate synthetase n=1 Tax=Orenia metallireducens TaxID=1413210 RepID=A0A285GJN5_9FIRM|nr:pantoate--beta-alanine ligase [Orenia metallireducens]PRX35805.1 pantothenate synthetase [Orenia metallireducens]SNY23820.1 pantothenate synthetase [Orenia metallireducens]
MEIFKTISEIRKYVKQERRAGKTIGFVPTMGYLHQGHLTLMKEAKKDNDIVIVSIFVNPTQFGPTEDYEQYPRNLEYDATLAKEVGVDIILAPEVEEVYLKGAVTTVRVDGLTDRLCGASRAGHFDGVCTIVSKLFNIVNPDKAYFGQKDAQQVLVIKKMVADLNFDLEIITVSIVREADGLAMSSRNKYLNQKEREAALVLYRSLQLAEQLVAAGETDAKLIKEEIIKLINQEPLAKIDYVEIVNQDNLEDINKIQGEILIALAVYIGETRLIDNLMLELKC